MLGVTTEAAGTAVICHLEGEIDLATTPQLRKAFLELTVRRRVVLDFGDVSFIDSAGLACLITGVRRLYAANASVVVSSAHGVVQRLFATIGIDRVIPLADSIDDAVHLLDEGPGIDPVLRGAAR